MEKSYAWKVLKKGTFTKNKNSCDMKVILLWLKLISLWDNDNKNLHLEVKFYILSARREIEKDMKKLKYFYYDNMSKFEKGLGWIFGYILITQK